MLRFLSSIRPVGTPTRFSSALSLLMVIRVTRRAALDDFDLPALPFVLPLAALALERVFFDAFGDERLDPEEARFVFFCVPALPFLAVFFGTKSHLPNMEREPSPRGGPRTRIEGSLHRHGIETMRPLAPSHANPHEKRVLRVRRFI